MSVYRYHPLAMHSLMFLSFFLSFGESSKFDGNTLIMTSIENDPVIIKCPLTPINTDNVAWLHNNNVIKHSKRIHQRDGNLHITNVNRHLDAGTYRCVTRTTLSQEESYSRSIELEIIWLKSAKVTIESAPKSNVLILKCQIIGAGITIINWYKDNIKLEESPRIELNADTLAIQRPTMNDNGTYRCMAHNGRAMVESDNIDILIADHGEQKQRDLCTNWRRNGIPAALVRVSATNRIVARALRHMRSIADDRMQILCRSKRDGVLKKDALIVESGNPTILNCNMRNVDRSSALKVNWSKDGKYYRHIIITGDDEAQSPDDDVNNSRVSQSARNGSLVISSTIPSDGGIYECSVSSDQLQLSSHRVRLDIIEALKFAPRPTSKHIELGTMAKIHCKVQGTPTPSVRWMKEPTIDLPESMDDINGTLHFRNVSYEDSGNYTCMANNTQGSISATVVITAGISPKFQVQPEGPITVNEMGTAMIHCLAVGEPKPTIQWDKDLEFLTVNNTDSKRITVLTNGTLLFREAHLEDDGVYGCTIGNSAGFKREEAQLRVRDPDDISIFDESEEDGFVITRAVYITVSVVVIYIVLVFGLMIWCRVRRKARKAHIQLLDKEANETGGLDHTNDEIAPCLSPAKKKSRKPQNGIVKTNGTNGKPHIDIGQKSDDTAASNHSKISKKSNFDLISMPRSILFDIVRIGQGDFGDVSVAKVKSSDLKHVNQSSLGVTNEKDSTKYKNSLNDINEIRQANDDAGADETQHALIKALNKVKDENVCIEFRRQIEMFRTVTHPNVVHLLGLCRDKDPHYLVLEHTELGDLKQYLMASSKQSPLKIEQILSIAQQVARGMDAIYRARYIHKDLAARNCVINANLDVKVSYPSASKDMYNQEYYTLKNTSVSLRWMAPECLEIDEHTIKSDVYSFGVLVWELLCSDQQLPEQQLANDEFLAQLQSGKLVRSIPDSAPDKLKSVLTSCWSDNQKERSSFFQLYSTISKISDQLQNNK